MESLGRISIDKTEFDKMVWWKPPIERANIIEKDVQIWAKLKDVRILSISSMG